MNGRAGCRTTARRSWSRRNRLTAASGQRLLTCIYRPHSRGRHASTAADPDAAGQTTVTRTFPSAWPSPMRSGRSRRTARPHRGVARPCSIGGTDPSAPGGAHPTKLTRPRAARPGIADADHDPVLEAVDQQSTSAGRGPPGGQDRHRRPDAALDAPAHCNETQPELAMVDLVRPDQPSALRRRASAGDRGGAVVHCPRGR